MSTVVIFTLVAAVGLVLLLVSMIFDGVLDMFNIDFTGAGIFSGASLGGLITGIGCGGLIGTAQGWPLGGSLALALLIGLVLAAVAIVLYRFLRKLDAREADQSIDRLVGSKGVVTAANLDGGRGLVQLTYLGGARTVGFVADLPLASGQTVVVTEILGPELVNVMTFEPGYDDGLR
ncbi:MAG: hypothetical protein LBV30_09360 [Propionibacteriaceae bacterium]|jgi:membrane protein implicated in regulation of membrane protease activity|nr:hypothetical protein [Propionibacteriaceae bacterium]